MHAEMFQTLADPTRLRIVEVLRAGELPVNDIVARVDIHQSGVSRHLRILSEAGFVRSRPAGLQRFYALRPEPFHELDAWVARYRSLWEARLDRFAAALARRAKAALPPQPVAGGAGPSEGPAREKRTKDKERDIASTKKGRST